MYRINIYTGCNYADMVEQRTLPECKGFVRNQYIDWQDSETESWSINSIGCPVPDDSEIIQWDSMVGSCRCEIIGPDGDEIKLTESELYDMDWIPWVKMAVKYANILNAE